MKNKEYKNKILELIDKKFSSIEDFDTMNEIQNFIEDLYSSEKNLRKSLKEAEEKVTYFECRFPELKCEGTEYQMKFYPYYYKDLD